MGLRKELDGALTVALDLLESAVVQRGVGPLEFMEIDSVFVGEIDEAVTCVDACLTTAL